MRNIEYLKAALGRLLARAARRRVLIIRQGRVWIDALAEALPLAPSTQGRKPVLLALGVTPVLAGAIEASLRAMHIDLPSVPPPTAVLAVAATILASLLGFYLASASIVMHQSLGDASWQVRSYVFTNYQTRIQLVVLVAGIVANLLLLWAWSAGAPPPGPFVTLLYVALCSSSSGAFYRLMRDTFRMHDPARLAMQPARNVRRFALWIESTEALSGDEEAKKRIEQVVSDLDCLAEIARFGSARVAGSIGIPWITAWSVCDSLGRFSAHRHKLPLPADWSAAAEPYYLPVSLTAGALLDALRPQAGGDAAWFARRAARILGASLGAPTPDSPQRIHDDFLPVARMAVAKMAFHGEYQDALTFIDEIAGSAHPDAADVVAPLVAALVEKHVEAAQASWRFHADDVGRGARLLASTPASSPAAALRGPRLARAAGHRIHAERHLAWRAQREPLETLDLPGGAAEALRRAQGAGEPGRERYARAALSRAYSEEIGVLVEEWGRRARDVDTGRFSGELPAAATAGMSWLAALDAMASAAVAAQAHRKALADLASGGLQAAEVAMLAQDAPPLIREARHAALGALAAALVGAPAEPTAAADYRGAVALTLAEALGRDLARGDNDAMGVVFPKLLANAIETAAGPRREGEETARGVAIAPLLAVIALSGLALAYDELRADGGAAAVRQAWGNASTHEWPMARQAQTGLDALDEEEQEHLSMHAWRWFAMVAGWQEALAEAIADHGLAYAPSPSGPPQAPRGAPPLIQVLGASAPPFPGFAVTPAELAGALILAPLSGETGEQLRARPALQEYFEAVGFHGESAR